MDLAAPPTPVPFRSTLRSLRSIERETIPLQPTSPAARIEAAPSTFQIAAPAVERIARADLHLAERFVEIRDIDFSSTPHLVRTTQMERR